MKPRKTLHRNIFIFSIAALALAGVGFSSWIIGQTITQKELTLGINVENVNVKAVITDAKITNTNITLDNTNTTHSLGFSSSIIVDEGVSSFDYKLSLVTKKANQIAESNKISISPKESVFRPVNTTTDYNYFTFTGLGDVGRDQVTYTKNILTSNPNMDNSTYPGFYFYQINELSNLGLGYGSYFNFQNPEIFYQTKLDEIKQLYITGSIDRDYYLKALTDAENELNNFKNKFQDVNIVLKLETLNIKY